MGLHLREAARRIGIAPATALRWIERLEIKTLTLPDGRKYLRAEDVERIQTARQSNRVATGTSRGMQKYWERKERSV